MIKPEYVVELLSENLKKTRNPLGIKNEKTNNWWKKVEISKEGDWLFFTGMLYQLTPYIEATVKFLEKIENSRLQGLLTLSKAFPVPFSLLKAITPREAREEAETILQKVYFLLAKSVDVFYAPHLDFYSGILLYDFGHDEAFAEHAKFVCKRLESAGIEKIVTPDPHTTYALKVLYPKFTGVEFDVKSYIELLSDAKSLFNEEFVIHDPCYYGRYLELSDRVREVLNCAGVKYRGVRYSGRLTNCCGGPVEALSPKISREIAKLRVEELGNSRIITFCPICLANLRRAGGNAVDFSMVVG